MRRRWQRRWMVRALASWGAAALTALLGIPQPHAELLEVRQLAAGMECPECARGLQLLVKQLPGVDTVETSWNRRTLSLRFHAGNQATLGQVRALVLKQHFQVREAEIVIAGQLLLDGAGRASLLVPESGLTYRIDFSGARAADWRRDLSAAAGTEVVMVGRVPGSPAADDPLTLWPLALRNRPAPPAKK